MSVSAPNLLSRKQELAVATGINFLWKQQVFREEKFGKEVAYQLDGIDANNKTAESPRLITPRKYKASKGFLGLSPLSNASQR